jgi:serine/threonine protein kinase
VVKVIWDKEAGKREIEFTVRCQTLHKNIVQLLCYYETSQAVVLFFEHCENLSLSEFFERLRGKGRILGEREVLRMMQDIAEAVDAMHRNGLAHRDIKPHNVFVTNTNLCKLGDFETVKEVQNDQAHLMSIPKGTPAYMSPVKAFQMERRDASPALDRAFADDLWAMGKTFFELCIGRTDERVCELTRKQPNSLQLQEYIKTSLREAKHSDFLALLIYRLLSSDPSFTCRTVCEELENLQLDSFSSFETLGAVDTKPLRCLTCRNSSSLTKLTCEHYQCNSCLSAYLSTRLTDPSTQSFADIRCSSCHKAIEYCIVVDNQRTYTEGVRRRLQRLEIINATDICTCQMPYYMLRKDAGRLVPYLFRCEDCKITFCSWCKKKNGHKLLGITKQCKSFKKAAKDFNFSCE